MADSDYPRHTGPSRSILSLAPESTRESTAAEKAWSQRERHVLRRQQYRTNAPAEREESSADETLQADVWEEVAKPVSSEDGPDSAESPRDQSESTTAYMPSVPDEKKANQNRAFDRSGSPADPAWKPLIDPASIVAGIARSKAIILAVSLIGATLGVMVAVTTPKTYEALAEILVDPRELKLVDRDLTQGGLPSDATLAIIENQTRVLRSRSVLTHVVDDLKLAEDPEFNGSLSGGIGQLLATLTALVLPSDQTSSAIRRDALAMEYLSRNLEVSRAGKTFVIAVLVRTRDPEKSALIANAIVAQFLETQQSLQASMVTRASDELTSRLSELQKGVETAERKIEAFRSENDLVDARGYLISENTIVQLNQQLSAARAETVRLNAKADSIKSLNIGQLVEGGLPEQVNSGVLAELRGQYASLKQEESQLAVKLGPRHPRLAAVNAQLEGARREIEAELRRVVSAIQVELKRAVQQEQELAAQLASLKAGNANVSDDLVTLRELEREAAAKRAVYESYLLRARETDEQKNINTANISVISAAVAPLESSGLSRKVIAFTGLLLGFLTGLGIAMLRGIVSGFRR